MSYLRRLEHDAYSLLQCVYCKGTALALAGADTLKCNDCKELYPVVEKEGFCSLLPRAETSDVKSQIQAFWGDLYSQLYSKNDQALTKDLLEKQLEDLEDLFVLRGHLAAVEMPLANLAGKKILEIGTGGGGHSCLFKKRGANVVAVDITLERVRSTAKKLKLVENGCGIAYQADAEILPFRDDSFDIVYSNGVLHHSKDTNRCVAEVYRILKPGGVALIMLYARHSANYWLGVVPKGIVTGEIFQGRAEAEWVGRVTEGKPVYGITRNPITRTYSRKELQLLFANFSNVGLRKSSFQFDNFAIPRLTQFRDWTFSILGNSPHPGGVLIYGKPYIRETKLELALGKYIGWTWNIRATKIGKSN